MTTVETIRFHLRDSVTDDDFRTLNQRVETEYMAKRPGFRTRETLRSADGEWLVIVHWASEADAKATIDAFFGAPETQAFIAAVDTSTVASGRYLPA
jgi:heme-degrading monooxygenase HmoA